MILLAAGIIGVMLLPAAYAIYRVISFAGDLNKWTESFIFRTYHEDDIIEGRDI